MKNRSSARAGALALMLGFVTVTGAAAAPNGTRRSPRNLSLRKTWAGGSKP